MFVGGAWIVITEITAKENIFLRSEDSGVVTQKWQKEKNKTNKQTKSIQ